MGWRTAVLLLVGLCAARTYADEERGRTERPRLVTQVGHNDWVNEIDVSRDGRLALTCSLDRTSRLWELRTGRELRRFDAGAPTGGRPPDPSDPTAAAEVGRTGSIARSFFSPDGQRAVTGGGAPLRLWDVRSGSEIAQFDAAPDSARFTPDGKWLVYDPTGPNEAAEFVAMDPATGQEVFRAPGRLLQVHPDVPFVLVKTGSEESPTLSAHELPTGRVAWSASGRVKELVGGGRRVVLEDPDAERVVDTSTGRIVALVPCSLDGPTFSPDGRLVVVPEFEPDIGLVAAVRARADGAVRFQLGCADEIAGVSDDGKRVLTHFDSCASVWDVATRKRLFQADDRARLSPGGDLVAVSGDKEVAVFKVDGGRAVLHHRTAGPLAPVCFLAHARVLAVATVEPRDDGPIHSILVLDVPSGRPRLKLPAVDVERLEATPDGKWLLAVGDETAVWSLETGKRVYGVNGVACTYASLYSQRGLLVTADEDGTVVTRAPDGTAPRRFEGHTEPPTAIAFSPDGTRMASVEDSGAVRLWDVAGAREVRRIEVEAGACVVAFLDPDSLLVDTGSDVRRIRLDTGAEVGRYGRLAWAEGTSPVLPDGTFLTGPRYPAHPGACLVDLSVGDPRPLGMKTDAFRGAAFSDDGRRVLILDDLGIVHLLEVEDLREVRTFRGGAGQVRMIDVSPTDRWVAIGRKDGGVVLLRGDEKVQLRGGTEFPVEDLEYSADGRTLVCVSDTKVWRWHVETPEAWSDRPEAEVVHRNKRELLAVAVSALDGRIVVGADDGSVTVLDPSGGTHRLRGHEGAVLGVDVSPDGKWLASCGRDGQVLVRSFPEGEIRRRLTTGGKRALRVAFGPDGKLAVACDDALRIFGPSADPTHVLKQGGKPIYDIDWSPQGRRLVTAGEDRTARVWSVEDGTEVARIDGHADWVVAARFKGHAGIIFDAAFLDERHLATAGGDDAVRIWEVATGRLLCSLYAFSGRNWVVVAPDGRFDSGDLERIEGKQWVMPDDQLRALPVEVFMRDYYEPRLLARLLDGEALPAVRDLASLNRALPEVRIVSVARDAEDAGRARVTVEVKGREQAFEREGGTIVLQSGAEDLRLFRDGRLVAWRDGPLDLKEGAATFVFADVPLWCEEGQEEIELSAYAFNTDRVKSVTARERYVVPLDHPTFQATTYLVAMGVDVFDQPEWNLAYAAADARALLGTLGKRFEHVVPVLLTSEREGPRRAAKKDLEAALADVAKKARPQDLVLITISTHGVSAKDCEFYLLPSDVAKRDDQGRWLTSCISAEELTQWLRPIDAEMVMVVDACQSAASVAKEGFKPGPMGSRGLGQLAYSKKMRILAASQAAEVALESGQIQHGLLTYALTTDGLEKGRADFEPKDGQVLLGEWLKYAEQRVPTLAAEVHKGEVRAVARGGKVRREQTEPARLVQTPALFDFAKRATDVVLMGR